MELVESRITDYCNIARTSSDQSPVDLTSTNHISAHFPDISDTDDEEDGQGGEEEDRQRRNKGEDKEIGSRCFDELSDLSRQSSLQTSGSYSCFSSRSQHRRQRLIDGVNRARGARLRLQGPGGRGFGKSAAGGRGGDESTMTSDSDTTGRIFSEDDNRSRVSTSTDITSVSRQQPPQWRQRQKRRRKIRQPSRASSISSITESSMSLNIITVTLNMDTVNFLGISIVGQSGTRGDGGIFVANIMKGGAVALDGRIEPNDMILQVNDISFENLSNDDAVRVLREATQKKGPIKLVVAKSFDPPNKAYFTIPRQEPVRPIDPGAWVQHTNAMRAAGVMPCIMEGSEGAPTPTPGGGQHHQQPRPGSASTMTSGGGSGSDHYNPNVAGGGALHAQGGGPPHRLSVDQGLEVIVRAMAQPDGGLDVRDRTWLKITIRNAFLGSDLVDWLLGRVDGLADKKEARKLAARMLREGYVKHTVNKITFSDQCYYVFGDIISAEMAALRVNTGGPERPPLHQRPGGQNPGDYSSDHDTVAPLPPPPSITPQPWGAPSPHHLWQGTSPSMVSGYASMPFPPGGPGAAGLMGGSYPNVSHAQPHVQMGTLPQAPPPPYPPAVILQHHQQQHAGAGPAPKSDTGGSGASNNSKGSGGGSAGEGGGGRKGSVGSRAAPPVPPSGAQGGCAPTRPEIAPKPLDLIYSSQQQQYVMQSTRAQAVNSAEEGEDDRGIDEVPRDMAASRQSFRMAMNQPCEFFVDYM